MDPIQVLISTATQYLGTTDPGPFLTAMNLPAGSAWCMAFAQFCLNGAAKATSRISAIYPSGLCMKVWNATPVERRRILPTVGAIAIWEDRSSPEGHAGIVTAVTSNGKAYRTIEGNSTNPLVGAGRGVYEHLHMVLPAQPGPLHRLGFLLPF